MMPSGDASSKVEAGGGVGLGNESWRQNPFKSDVWVGDSLVLAASSSNEVGPNVDMVLKEDEVRQSLKMP